MSNHVETIKRIGKVSATLLGAAFAGLSVVAALKKPASVYADLQEEQNPLQGKKVVFVEDQNDPVNANGVRGHLEEDRACPASIPKPRLYDRTVKRALDVAVSFAAMTALAPVYAGIALAIKIDDPGPAIFTQKRFGRDKQYFQLHKFRSMKTSTPRDVPTAMLENPDQYITRVGRFIRAHSLDELPQLWDIFLGNMSFIGPRPVVFTEELLIAERDRYDANSVLPGLTGWAQIHGRDELGITEKSRLDGAYVQNESLIFDTRCFLGTISKVLRDDSVVEGGTGSFIKSGRSYTNGKTNAELRGNIGFPGTVTVDMDARKRVLVTAQHSYLGNAFVDYARENYPDNFEIDRITVRDDNWKLNDFSKYDVIYHVAGLNHPGTDSLSEKEKEAYYRVNTDLAIEVAQKAKAEGVKEFILMSSLSVYGESAPCYVPKMFSTESVPAPADFFCDSEMQADMAVRDLADDHFKVIVLRPPMTYGMGCRGNYPMLAKLACKALLFPSLPNERSMIYIDNLDELLCQVMLIKDNPQAATVLVPQNAEYSNTADMAKEIAAIHGKYLHVTPLLNPGVTLAARLPGRIGEMADKAFGNKTSEQNMSVYPGLSYRNVSLQLSIHRMESVHEPLFPDCLPKRILVVTQLFYPENFRINDMCIEWVKRGHQVTVITGIPNYPAGEFFPGFGYTQRRHEMWNGVEVIRIPLIPRGHNKIGLMANYASFMMSGMIAPLLHDVEADCVFSFEVSPMTQLFCGLAFAKKLHVPHYVYVQDLWPENVETVLGIHNKLIIQPIDWMVDYIYKHVDEIFATSPSFVDTICNRKIPVSRDKVHFWPQYAEEFYQPLPKAPTKEIPADGSFHIVFTGNIGFAQGLQILPRTAELLKNENVKFVMVGDGRFMPNFKQEVSERDVEDKFIMVPRQPAERIPELLAACDVAFLSFQDAEIWANTIPAKLQSYMACGMPVLGSARGETVRVIEEAQCGVCTPPGDAEALAEAVRKLMKTDTAALTRMSRNARHYFEQHFDKQMLMDEMEEYINR